MATERSKGATKGPRVSKFCRPILDYSNTHLDNHLYTSYLTVITALVMSSLSTQDTEDLHGFLDDKLLQFISDKHPPTTNDVSSPILPELTEKELDELLQV